MSRPEGVRLNPLLCRRFNSRTQKFTGLKCMYLPMDVTENDRVGVGTLVTILSPPVGEKNRKLVEDDRIIEVAKGKITYHLSDFKGDRYTVMLKDLVPLEK